MPDQLMEQIVLITYLNRSGSTFLANLLSSSKDICVCPEGDAVVEIFLEAPGDCLPDGLRERRGLNRAFERDGKMSAWNIGEDVGIIPERALTRLEAFRELLKYYRDRNKPAAGTIVFKAERIGSLLGKIIGAAGENFPVPVKFLSLVRDPRAVFASQVKTHIPGSDLPMSKNPVWTAIRWKSAQKRIVRATSVPASSPTRSALKDRSALPTVPVSATSPVRPAFPASNDRVIHSIKYEDLVLRTKTSIGEIGGFLQIDLRGISPARGDLLSRLPPGTRDIHPLADKEPQADRIDAWKSELGERDIYLIERTCGRSMPESGYERIMGRTRPFLEPVRFWQICLFHARRVYLLFRFLIYIRKFTNRPRHERS